MPHLANTRKEDIGDLIIAKKKPNVPSRLVEVKEDSYARPP